MSSVQVRVPTGFRSLSEARPALERAVKLGDSLVEARWADDELHLAGPGASARVILDRGELVGRAQLKPPASFFASIIEREFEGVLRQAASESRLGASSA